MHMLVSELYCDPLTMALFSWSITLLFHFCYFIIFLKILKSFLSFKSPLLPLYLGSLHFSPLFWHLNHSLSRVSFSSSSFSNLVLEWFEMQISSEFFPLSPSRPSFFLISNSKFLSMVHKSVRTNVVAYLTSVISCSFLTDTRELEAS